jgi:hypothetical protein
MIGRPQTGVPDMSADATRDAVRFACRVFTWAPVYGVIVLTPLLFAERIFAAAGRPPVNYPVYLYGFIGAALLYQLQYWLIGRDPARYRVFMPVAALAKLAFFSTAAILFAQARADALVMGGATVDLLIGILFFIAWRRLRPA